MSTKARVKRLGAGGSRVRRRAWHAAAALTALSSAACGSTEDFIEPILTGTIVLTTQTSGFMKDDGYELLVDGTSKGPIGANDEVMLEDLDAATYQVALGDVSENCSVESASVEVTPEQTTNVALEISCAYDAPTSYTIRFGRARPNLDDGSITECPFSICSTNEGWDLYVHNNTSTTPHSVIRQNQTTAVEIAHLPGVSLSALTEAHYSGATFTTDLVADPFDAGRVILIRTDLGDVYALGNPTEDMTAQTLSFEAALIAHQ